LGAKEIDLGMVRAWSSLVILARFFDLGVCGVKTKIMVLENWLDSNLTNASKVMWEKFGSKRN